MNIYKKRELKTALKTKFASMKNNENNDLGTFGKDWVFVLERMSDANVEVKSKNEGGKGYILEGIAAVFGKENNNHRIYEEAEYLPHLEYLQKKIAKKSLLGELDHPANFETSLKNASHVVEALEYDKEARHVKIRIRLIEGHPAGEMAIALVKAGVPLHISSRAAGVVKENKKVQIKKIFTYDLVESPGFEQAELERIYESVNMKFNEKKNGTVTESLEDVTNNVIGENSESVRIYRIDENHQGAFLKALEVQEKNNISEMANRDFVTVDDLNGYSQVIKKELEALKEKIKNPATANEANSTVTVLEERIERIEKYMKYLAENVDKNIQYSEYLAENVDKTIEYSRYLAENLDKTISYSEYLAENVDKSISYGEYLAENLDKSITYANYLAENLEKGISYAEYLAENVDKAISYGEYLAENLDRTIAYGEYLAENLDKSLDYSEYIAEKVDQSIEYGEYLSETLDKGITYSEYLAEKIEKNIAYSEYIAENVNIDAPKTTTPEVAKAEVNENKETVKVDYSTLTTKINSLLETVKNQKTASNLNESKYAFYKLLNEDKRKEFVTLDETKKEKVVKALENGAYFSEVDVIKKWDAALEEKVVTEPKFITEMPEKYKPIWESMSVAEQEGIISASKLRKLDTAYQINNFWATRPGINKEKTVGLIRLNENETAANAAKPNMSGYSNDYMAGVADELAKRFKK